MVITIHVNPTQPHQLEHARWFEEGFKRHGLKLEVTSDVHKESDVHIVSGPHYAKEFWVDHPRTIWLDRAYWHEDKSGMWKSMDWVSLGWLRSDGGREFDIGSNREQPTIAHNAADTGTIFLADFRGPIERADTVRRHPQEGGSKESLRDALRRHRTAIGYKTTALVTAALEGLDVICKDPRSIMFEDNWFQLLPYADWRWDEIMEGDAWEHLKERL